MPDREDIFPQKYPDDDQPATKAEVRVIFKRINERLTV